MITNPKLHSPLLIIWTFYAGLQQYVFFFHLSAIQTCVSLLRQGRPAPHREARQKRREMRLRQQAEQEELELRMRELQVANEAKQLELEKMRKVRRTHTQTHWKIPMWIQSDQETPGALVHFCSILNLK